MTSAAEESRLPSDVAAVLHDLVVLARTAPAPTGDLEQVSTWLYAAWYTATATADGDGLAVSGRRNLAAALQAALPASERWQEGWVVVECSPDGGCLAAHQGQVRALRPGDYANVARPGVPLVPGDCVAVVERLSWSDEQTGFWHVQSTSGAPSPPLLRLYWSVRPTDVPHVLEVLCSAVDALALRYALKCPLSPHDFTRVDSLVVYLEKSCWRAAEPAVRRVIEQVGTRLRPAWPPLTLRIAPGVAFAEDPGGGESFGQSRCRALAPAVLALREAHSARAGDGVAALGDALRAAGIDPQRPWLCNQP